MRRLLAIVLVAIPILIVACSSSAKPARELTDDEAVRYVSEVRTAIHEKQFDKVRPLVRVTGRAVGGLFVEGRRPQWADGLHKAFRMIVVAEAASLQEPCIEAVIRGAKATGQEWRGLPRFFDDGFAAWIEEQQHRGRRIVAIPCFAEFVVHLGKAGWLVVANWSSHPRGRDAHHVGTAHIALFVVDPRTGEIRAVERCC